MAMEKKREGGTEKEEKEQQEEQEEQEHSPTSKPTTKIICIYVPGGRCYLCTHTHTHTHTTTWKMGAWYASGA